MQLHLLLFMTRGMSLAAWENIGTLTRELALYEEMAKHGVTTRIISWGGQRDLEIAKTRPWLSVCGNIHELPIDRYERLMPLLHARSLIWADIIKSNQTNGADCALRCAQFWRKPFIARCGYVWSEFCRANNSPVLEQALHVEKQILDHCDKAIVTTTQALDSFVDTHHCPPEKIVCIPNYIPDFFFDPQQASPRPSERRVITQVGRLSSQKNLFALVEACAGLNVTLRLIGDGEQRQALAELAERLGTHVEFLGNVPHHTLPGLLHQSTICTLVSHFEGHPKALIEYMACGCAILATNARGLNTVIEDGRTGVLCETDAASIRQGLLSLLQDNELRQTLSQNARCEAQQYSLKSTIQAELREYAAFPPKSPVSKFLSAVRAMASFGKRRLLGVLTLCKNWKCRALSSPSIQPEAPLPSVATMSRDVFCTHIMDQVQEYLTNKSPAETLRALFALEAAMYPLQGRASVAYGGGTHSKHRHTNYHDFFIKHIRAGEKVLDIGCGNGFLTYDMAAKAGAKVTGIELSADNVARARASFQHPLVEYRLGDALTDIPEGEYDTIVLSNVLEHLPGRSAFLAQLCAKFQPRRFLLRVPLFERDWRVPLKKELGIEWRLDPTHETEYTQESFTAELAEAGLLITGQETRWGEIWCEAVPAN